MNFNYFWEVHLTDEFIKRASIIDKYIKDNNSSYLFRILDNKPIPKRLDLKYLENRFCSFNNSHHFFYGISSNDCVTILMTELIFGERCSTTTYKASRLNLKLQLPFMDEEEIKRYCLIDPKNIYGIKDLLYPPREGLEIIFSKKHKKLIIPTISLREIIS